MTSAQIFRLLLVVLLVHATAGANCPSGWRRFENKCFHFNKDTATFNITFEYCKSLNATMATIHSDSEQRFLSNMTFVQNAPNSVTWLGSHRVAAEISNFNWTDGSSFNYTNWVANEPSCHSSCCAVDMTRDRDGKVVWRAPPCQYSRQKLCQIVLRQKRCPRIENQDCLPPIISKLHTLNRSLEDLENLSNLTLTTLVDLDLSVSANFLTLNSNVDGIMQTLSSDVRNNELNFRNVSELLLFQTTKFDEISRNILELAKLCVSNSLNYENSSAIKSNCKFNELISLRKSETSALKDVLSQNHDLNAKYDMALVMLREVKKQLNEVLLTKSSHKGDKERPIVIHTRDSHNGYSSFSSLIVTLIIFTFLIAAATLIGLFCAYLHLKKLVKGVVPYNAIEMSVKNNNIARVE